MSSVVETVTEMVTPILDEQNFELVEVEFVKEGKSWFLRVFIDKEGGIDIEECAFVSEKLSENLMQQIQIRFLKLISWRYPPGSRAAIEKESDYEKALGDYVHVSLYQPVDGEKQYEGFLQSFDAEQLTLKIRIKTREKN